MFNSPSITVPSSSGSSVGCLSLKVSNTPDVGVYVTETLFGRLESTGLTIPNSPESASIWLAPARQGINMESLSVESVHCPWAQYPSSPQFRAMNAHVSFAVPTRIPESSFTRTAIAQIG